MHTGEKPYQCPYDACGKSFSRIDNMKQHYNRHLKKKRCQELKEKEKNATNSSLEENKQELQANSVDPKKNNSSTISSSQQKT